MPIRDFTHDRAIEPIYNERVFFLRAHHSRALRQHVQYFCFSLYLVEVRLLTTQSNTAQEAIDLSGRVNRDAVLNRTQGPA